MDHQLIQNLSETLSTKDPVEELVETHISWVILTRDLAFKIKKPVKFSFLDFSTLEKRRYYCHREVVLNQRLAPKMYLNVAEIRQDGVRTTLEESSGKIIDYAVKMTRMESSRQMNILLEKNQVQNHHIEQLAQKLSGFHRTALAMKDHLNLDLQQEDYADILHGSTGKSVEAFIKKELGAGALKTIKRSIDFSADFLRIFSRRLKKRAQSGFKIDGHGDLHSKNIFLLKEPVIFDCIEFNDHFRRLDVLDELAFFCMDLELYGRNNLSEQMLQTYQDLYPVLNDDLDYKIFQYYQLYRANVKIKVNALKAIQAGKQEVTSDRTALASNYMALFNRYFKSIQD